MIIEIKGIGFPNKGAELMLLAAQQAIISRIPDIIFCMEVTHRNIRYLKNYNLKPKWPTSILGKTLTSTLDVLPMPVISDKKINVILDCSGFAYGDHWGFKKAKSRLSKNIEAWKSEGKKVILLPQAFGPFTENQLVSAMETIIVSSDLIYTRDKISLDYLKALNTKKSNIQLAPDYTSLVKPKKYMPEKRQRVAIIPNKKMLLFNDDLYIKLITKAINYIEITMKKHVDIVLHETKHDKTIVEQICKNLRKPIDVISNENPETLKAIIGNYEWIIGSRYHAILSALNQGVPSLVMGWSHKYDQLMEDWGTKDLLMDLSDPDIESLLVKKIDLLSTPEKQNQVRALLKQKNQKFQKNTEEMWDDVTKLMLS